MDSCGLHRLVLAASLSLIPAACFAESEKEKEPAAPQAGEAPKSETESKKPDAAVAEAGDEFDPATIRYGSRKAIDKPAGALRVASYNIENLFDDVDDPALSGRYEDIDDEKTSDACEAAARAIRLINPDVLALQEIESRESLIAFRDEYLKGMGYEHVVSIDAGDERGIEQAVLSRYPLSDATNWPRLDLGGTHPAEWGREPNENAGKPITFHRSPLRVTVTVPVSEKGEKTEKDAKPYELTLFVVHHKSGGSPAIYWRDKESAKTAELYTAFVKEHPEANVLLCGDFNSESRHEPMRHYTSAGLVDVFADRQRGDTTQITHDSGRTIDFILLSPGARHELVAETKFILGTPSRPAGSDWRTTPAPKGWASDHYPLVIDLMPIDK